MLYTTSDIQIYPIREQLILAIRLKIKKKGERSEIQQMWFIAKDRQNCGCDHEQGECQAVRVNQTSQEKPLGYEVYIMQWNASYKNKHFSKWRRKFK